MKDTSKPGETCDEPDGDGGRSVKRATPITHTSQQSRHDGRTLPPERRRAILGAHGPRRRGAVVDHRARPGDAVEAARRAAIRRARRKASARAMASRASGSQ